MKPNHAVSTQASYASTVVRNNPRQCLVQAAAAKPPQEETTWESLALASSFRPSLLAHRCGVSLRTLQRHFTKHYRITVSESLRKMRLSLAYTRLTHGERIKSVAYDLGYKQLSHFSRDFRSFYGLPPRVVQGGFPAFPKQFTTRE
ncbi:MAG: helix-turn-helix domain-containing protein [Limisphaerales bacterium]